GRGPGRGQRARSGGAGVPRNGRRVPVGSPLLRAGADLVVVLAELVDGHRLPEEAAGTEELLEVLAVLGAGQPGLAPPRRVQPGVVPPQAPPGDRLAALGAADELVRRRPRHGPPPGSSCVPS